VSIQVGRHRIAPTSVIGLLLVCRSAGDGSSYQIRCITARFANEYGRDVYVLPGSLDNPRSLGCLDLVNNGAQVILSESHLLEMLGAMPQIAPESPSIESPSTPNLEPELAGGSDRGVCVI